MQDGQTCPPCLPSPCGKLTGRAAGNNGNLDMALTRFIAAGATCFGLLAATTVLADSHGDEATARAVAARQAHMKLNAFNLGPLGAMAKGEMEYDADRAAGAAANLDALAGIDQAGYWPEGSDAGFTDGSKALPAVWENMPEFEQRQQALAEATAQLAAVAGDGLDALKGAMGPVGQACSACHKTFRQSE